MLGCKFEVVRAEPPCSGLLPDVGSNKTKLISSSYEKDKKQPQSHSEQGTDQKSLRMQTTFFESQLLEILQQSGFCCCWPLNSKSTLLNGGFSCRRSSRFCGWCRVRLPLLQLAPAPAAHSGGRARLMDLTRPWKLPVRRSESLCALADSHCAWFQENKVPGLLRAVYRLSLWTAWFC